MRCLFVECAQGARVDARHSAAAQSRFHRIRSVPADGTSAADQKNNETSVRLRFVRSFERARLVCHDYIHAAGDKYNGDCRQTDVRCLGYRTSGSCAVLILRLNSPPADKTIGTRRPHQQIQIASRVRNIAEPSTRASCRNSASCRRHARLMGARCMTLDIS